MTKNDVFKFLKDNGYVCNIGQIDKKTQRELDKLVCDDVLNKSRELWPSLSFGTCIKTFYRLNNAEE